MSTYTDLDTSFSIHPTTNDVLMLVDVQAAKASLKDLLLTAQGEKPDNPTYGIGIRNLQFETLSPVLISFVKRNAIIQIQKYLPEINVQQLDIGENPDTGEINLIIQYFVQGITQLQTYTLTVNQDR